MPITFKPVKSSNLKAIGYDGATKRLAVQFSGGAIYHYEDVPPEVYADFDKAESAGRFFMGKIRNAFTGVKQPDPQPEEGVGT